MDSKVEKSCLEEISHHVCDEDKKLVVSKISNDWSLSPRDSEAVIQKWLGNFNEQKKVLKTFIVRGVDSNGNGVVTVVPEEKLDNLKRKLADFTSTLYSIELEGGNGRRLNIPDSSKSTFVSLPLESPARKCKVLSEPPPAPEVKKEPLKETASISKASKGMNALFSSTAVKKEKSSPPKRVEKVKEEVKTPKKESPKKKDPPKNAKATSAKSITSFFSKPGTSSAAKPQPRAPEPEKVEIKEELKEEKPSKKRALDDSDDEVIPGTPQEKKKKLKKEPVKAKGRSRLMKICDSSSDEEEEKKSNQRKEEEVEIEKEEEVKEKENTTPTKENGNSEPMDVDHSKGSRSMKKRRKVKKTVTKTFEDEDGFINTVHVTEEVTCSEDDEPEIVEPPKAVKAAERSNGARTDAPKGKVSPPAGKKQGSILSFFSKK